MQCLQRHREHTNVLCGYGYHISVHRTVHPSSFYFLSSAELLDILGQAKQPQTVQPHIIKLFSGIARLDFGDCSKSCDVLGMVCGEHRRPMPPTCHITTQQSDTWHSVAPKP